ncbi:MAG: chemotaxis-specific protein-glutamate methyltransferase CheB [Nanobdellota archaeon]
MYSVLVVDDSALTRKILRRTIDEHEDFEVVDYAVHGENALDKVKKHNPDVITLDIEMQKLDGIGFLKKLMKENPKPVLIVSTHAKEDSKVTLEALEAGAVDFLLKPRDISKEENFNEFKKSLFSKLKAVLESTPKAIHKKKKKLIHKFKKNTKHIVLIGASTGGPSTLKRLFSELPGNLPFSMLVVQHMPVGFTKVFAQHLNDISEFEVKEAAHGDILKDNTAYICPADFHMVLVEKPEDGTHVINLTKTAKIHGVRPSFDVLLESVAPLYKERLVMVVLTGMGKDGLKGSEVVKANKGKVLVEAEESCIIYGMPRVVTEKNLADAVVSLEKLPVSIVHEVEN